MTLPVRQLWTCLILATALLTPSHWGWSRTGGDGHVHAMLAGESIEIFTYRPRSCASTSLVIVFAGYGRTAQRYRDRAKPIADRACLSVVAPLLDRERFPNWRYHRAGVFRNGIVQPRSKWTIVLVNDLVRWARAWEAEPNAEYRLFGHSAGGQFLSRLAAYSPPPDAARIVISNPSSYVTPTTNESAPYGFGGFSDERERRELLKQYLALPITIYLGQEDTGSELLDDSEEALRQGPTRYARGINIFRAGEAAAKASRAPFNWKLVVVPGVGHSSAELLRADQALEAFGLNATIPAN